MLPTMWPDPPPLSVASLPLLALSAALAAPALLVLLYPVSLWVLGRLSPFRGDARPREARQSVALVTVASALDARLERKLGEFSRLARSAPVSETFVGLDGASAPVGSVRRDAAAAPRWVCTPTRRGKNAVLREIHALARADILLFSDVDAELDEESVGTLLAAFADESVGAVTGRRHIVDGTRFGSAQAGYGDLDSLIRSLEMRALGSVTSCDGKLYAIRRDCLDGELPGDVTDDLYTGLGARVAGLRLVSAPDALARIGRPARDVAHELERRRRVTARGLSTLRHRRAVLDPRRHGWYALALVVNKLMRRLAAPCGVLAVLVLGAALLTLPANGLSRTMLSYVLPPLLVGALAVAALAAVRGRGAALAYLALGVVGMTLGVIDYLRGKRVHRWEPRKQDAAGPPDGVRREPELAFLVSHYPKLTETFVLDEVRGLERSYEVDVHPLSPTGRRAAAGRSVPGRRLVHEHPLAPAVLRDACLELARSPRSLFAPPLAAILGGARRHPRVALKTLALVPKTLSMAWRMRRRPVDHVHAAFANYSATMAWMLARSRDLPFSFVAHANDIFKSSYLLDAKVRDAAAVIAISHYNRAYLLRTCPSASAERIHVLPTGVDCSRYAFRLREPPAPLCRVLSIGSLLEKKGHPVLIEAIAALRAAGRDVRCRIVGEGPERESLERLIAERGLGEAVELMGGQGRERVHALLEESDVFALACQEARDRSADGIPVALMEAMASGLPVVSTRLRAIPELVEDGRSGLLCEPGDAEALARCLARLLDDEALRESLVRAARRRIETSFDQRAIAEARSAIIAKAIATHRLPSAMTLASESLNGH